MRHFYRHIAIAAGTLALVSACSSNGAATDTSEGPLPIRSVSSSEEPAESLEQLSQEADVVVNGTLVEVIDGYQYPVDEEAASSSGPGVERVGLVFMVNDTYLDGDIKDTITIEGFGYEIDLKTKERTADLEVNGISSKSWAIGDDYLFVANLTDTGYRFYSTLFMASIEDDGTIEPLSRQNGFAQLGVRTIDDVRAAFTDGP